MSIIIAIILGIVQGLTEFLPVSSSGHLVLFEKLFGISEGNLAFNIVVHLGSLLAVIICYRKTLFDMVKKPFDKKTYLLIAATIPTVVIFFLFRDFFEDSFSGAYLGVCFLVTSVMLVFCSIFMRGGSSQKIDYKTAIVMGLFQGFAIVPGVSRSGSTLTGGLCMGADRKEVADFSFLMSIPVILGSLVLEIVSGGFADAQILPLVFGFVFSFLSGLLSIKFMLKLIKDKSLYPFAIYLVIVSILTFVLL